MQPLISNFATLEQGSTLGAALPSSYNPMLATLSVMIASLAAYAALGTAGRISVAETPMARRLWLSIGSTAMGCGVWAMHFIGMLAFTLPVRVSYDFLITLISIVPAVLASALVLHLIGQERIGRLQLIFGGTLMGAGIGTMHYTGMAAMRMDAIMFFDPMLFAVSIVVAVILSAIALYTNFLTTRSADSLVHWSTLGAALIMGTAVSGMHYTGMAAAHFYSGSGFHTAGELTLDPVWLGGWVGLASALIIGLAIFIIVVDQRLKASRKYSEDLEKVVAERTRELASANSMITALNEQLSTENVSLEEQRSDLETMLDMTTAHADTVEEELHERAEAAVLRSEQQLRMIVEATPVPVAISRVNDGEIVYANAMMGALFQVSTQSLVGQNSLQLYHDPADRQRLIEILQREKSVDHREVCLRRSDSSLIWAEISLRLLDFNEEPSVLAGLHDITHLKEMNQASSRFVPQEYLGFLEKDSITNIGLGNHVTGEMTVMFSDLRGFTAVSETMTPQENFAFINSYLGRVSPVVRQHNGFIIKYLGDGIHAIFPQSADDGVRAGIDTLEQVNDYNEYRRTKDRLPIATGIGVNSGYMMVGIVGEQDRMQGDAFSDDVNLTARLEGLTKIYGTTFIISRATYERLEDPDRYSIRYLDKVQVVGRTNALDLYEVYDADLPRFRALKQDSQAEYEAALELYFNREFESAQAKLFGVLQRNPRDKVAWHHLVNATRLADNGAPEGWSGVTVMTKK